MNPLSVAKQTITIAKNIYNSPLGNLGLKFIGYGGLMIVLQMLFDNPTEFKREPITIEVEDYDIID